MPRHYERPGALAVGGVLVVGLILIAARGVGPGSDASSAHEKGSGLVTTQAAAPPRSEPVAHADAGKVPVSVTAVLEEKPHFPLMVRKGDRYLVDASGKPFLIHGDTAWSLIAELTREEAEQYLEDRRLRGFNAVLVNLIEHRFATRAPANAYEHAPFRSGKDFATPNDDYFAHAEWVLRRAEEKGLLVLLAPAYVGNGGGGEGWYQAMVASGPAKLREYGRYLGRRFAEFKNIVWVHGGDYDPPDKDLVRAIVDGIRAFDKDALHTAHASPGTAALEYWSGDEWLHVNNIYTYESVREAALQQYKRPEGLPLFLFESAYEDEHGATELRLRRQAYQAVLSGAAGHVFGNNPIWHFSGPGIYSAPTTWQDALDSRGAQSMTHFWNLFSKLEWWRLEPDERLLRGAAGHGDARVAAARAADGSFAVIYLPARRDVTVDLGGLAGPRVDARWFDPANGQFSPASEAPFAAEGLERLRPPGTNSAKLGDWVLVLTSHR